MLQNETFKAIFNHCDSAIFEPRKKTKVLRGQKKSRRTAELFNPFRTLNTHMHSKASLMVNKHHSESQAQTSGFFLPGHRKAFALLSTSDLLPCCLQSYKTKATFFCLKEIFDCVCSGFLSRWRCGSLCIQRTLEVPEWKVPLLCMQAKGCLESCLESFYQLGLYGDGRSLFCTLVAAKTRWQKGCIQSTMQRSCFPTASCLCLVLLQTIGIAREKPLTM